MKTILLSFFVLILSTNAHSQLRLSFGGFYSSPLHQFCIDDYSDGFGAQLGLGMVHNIDSTWSLEAGLNFQYGVNGKKTTKLSLGDYDLKNTFSNWQLKLNLVKKIGKLSPYIGFHIGSGEFYITEYIAFNEPQENQDIYYNDILDRTSQNNYGAQLGTYIHLNDFVDINVGVSFNKSYSKVKFIDFESYTFDGTEIDYQKKMSVPFLLLINAGISFKLHPVLSCISSGNSADSYYQDDYYHENRYTRSRSSRSSCESSSSPSSNKHYKNKTEPKLIKNGKTPVGYK